MGNHRDEIGREKFTARLAAELKLAAEHINPRPALALILSRIPGQPEIESEVESSKPGKHRKHATD